jgi:hypothetical protein
VIYVPRKQPDPSDLSHILSVVVSHTVPYVPQLLVII